MCKRDTIIEDTYQRRRDAAREHVDSVLEEVVHVEYPAGDVVRHVLAKDDNVALMCRSVVIVVDWLDFRGAQNR